MLIPSDTANPLNSLLNSGLILKFRDSFSLSSARPSPFSSVRLLIKVRSPCARHDCGQSLNAGNDTDFYFSCNPERQKNRIPDRKSLVTNVPFPVLSKIGCYPSFAVIAKLLCRRSTFWPSYR